MTEQTEMAVGRTAAPAEPGAVGVKTTLATAGDRLVLVFNRQITHINMSKAEALYFAENMAECARRLPDTQR